MAAQRLKDMLGFLTALEKSGFNPAAHDGVKDTQQKMLHGCLLDLQQAPSIAIQEATQMLQDVQSASIPDWMKEEIIKGVQEKVSSTAEEQNGGAKRGKNLTQKHLHLQNYMTESDWKTLRSSSHSLSTKVQCLCRRFGLLKLTCPSEGTSVLAVSLLSLASHQGPPEELLVDGFKTFSLLADFKCSVKSFTKKMKRSDLLVYPANPQDMPEALFKAAYAPGEPPVECPMDCGALAVLCEDLPARKSNVKVSGARVRASFRRDDPITGMLGAQNLLEQLASLMNGQPRQLPLTMLGPRKRNLLAIGNEGGQDPGQEPAAKGSPTPEPSPARTPLALPAPPTEQKPVAEVKDVDEMAELLTQQLTHNKSNAAKRPSEHAEEEPNKAPKTEKPKAKGKAKADKKKKGNNAEKGPKTKGKEALGFPGTDPQAPIHHGGWTIYICPKSSNFRVKKDGDKKDKAFSWKTSDPSKAWDRVKEFLKA